MGYTGFPQHVLAVMAGLMISVALQAQTPAKPRVKTSAKPEQTTVFVGNQKNGTPKTVKAKPEEKTAKKDDAQATKTGQGGKTAKAAPKKGSKREKKENTGGRYMALKTNVPFDAIGALNLGYEVQVHRKMTLDIPLTWSLWDAEREHALRIAALQPELRWWTGSEVGSGHFFGLHAHMAWFNLKWEENRYQDNGRPLLGAGLSYGYKLPLGEHWGAEFNLGLGYANMKYDTYYNIDNGAKLNTRVRHYWGITRLGASLIYRF
ncbi:DUF3575 domain-containing protein [Bacteroides uniformis]